MDTNIEATNESGFTALGGGVRTSSPSLSMNNGYLTITHNANFWSLTESNLTEAWSYGLMTISPWMGKIDRPKVYGMSVRCVKD